MKISTFIAFAVCLALFVSARPTPELSNEYAVSKDKLMPKALKKVGEDARKKVGKNIGK
ncbi:hypothetical protein H8356DRAFT_1436290 [Neocallimastix lanati (nom. inval.)]|nr:hypothetical protein H8356DRAFT_1436290 [Neocallimastix sp. JGI-2020a]